MMKNKMKALLSVTLVGTMIMGFSLTALAADGVAATVPTAGNSNVTNNGTGWVITGDDDEKLAADDDDQSQIGVFAKVNIAGSAVYKVDIAWGTMQFSYSNTSRKWDPSTHTYTSDNDGSVGWETSLVDGANNKVTVTNHSNEAITAGFAYAHTEADGKTLFNEDPTSANAVRGFFFDTNSKAMTAAGVLTNSATVVDALTSAVTIAKCPEGATVGEGNIPFDEVFFTFDGTPDPEAVTTVGSDYNKVGVITVTIGNAS